MPQYLGSQIFTPLHRAAAILYYAPSLILRCSLLVLIGRLFISASLKRRAASDTMSSKICCKGLHVLAAAEGGLNGNDAVSRFNVPLASIPSIYQASSMKSVDWGVEGGSSKNHQSFWYHIPFSTQLECTHCCEPHLIRSERRRRCESLWPPLKTIELLLISLPVPH